MFDFSNFKPVETANTRDNSHLVHGQNFNFKYKKFNVSQKDPKTGEKTKVITSAFTLSTKLFEKLALNGPDKGLIEVISPEGKSYLAVVGNEDAVFLRTNKKNEKGKKGQTFKSTLLETSLSQQGVLDITAVGKTQKLDLTLVEGSESAKIGEMQTYGIYEVTKAAESELTEEEKAEDAKDSQEDSQEEVAVSNGPVDAIEEASPSTGEAPAASPENTSDDDF